MDSTKLHEIGTEVFEAFDTISTAFEVATIAGKRHVTLEAQRFRLWAHSLGLHQLGHASLDYRVRDADVVKDRFADILEGLLSHLENLLAVALGQRLPYEEQESKEEKSDNDDKKSSASGSASQNEADNESDSDASIHEVDFRLASITESVDALYSLATKIRNPHNRPQRTINQLFKHVPGDIRTAYIQERELAEISIVAYVQRQQLHDGVGRSSTQFAHDQADDMVNRYASTTNWLIQRTGTANVRRRQQFVYWKEHALRLSHVPIKAAPKKPVAELTRTGDAALQEQVLFPDMAAMGDAMVAHNEMPFAAPSMATSATRLSPDVVKLNDLRSVVSHQSRVSTVMNLRGDKIEWPPPPTQVESSRFFTCPYCKTLCPQKYLSPDAWRVHIVNDLQPYNCTYEDCQDPNRLYRTRQEWIDHESQHTRVWHCQEHSEEFETQPEYVNHLERDHVSVKPKQLSPELIASVVGPSLQPHRSCPFCPTDFAENTEMQKHLIFHLERLALLTLPVIGDGSEDESDTEKSSESRQVQRRGRSNSIAQDFHEEDLRSFAEISVLNKQELHVIGQDLTAESLQQTLYVQAMPAIPNWLDTLQPNPPNIESELPSEYRDIDASKEWEGVLIDSAAAVGVLRGGYPRNWPIEKYYEVHPRAPTEPFFPWVAEREPLANFRRPDAKTSSDRPPKETATTPSELAAGRRPIPDEKKFPWLGYKLFSLSGRSSGEHVPGLYNPTWDGPPYGPQ